MDEYIKREALRLGIFNTMWRDSEDVDIAYDMAESIPAADVVEVVRCEKCRHWDKERRVCNSGRNYIFYVTKPDFFCADGARMDGE